MNFLELQNGSDIRGYALGEKTNLTEDTVRRIADAFIYWLSNKTGKDNITVAIGMDSRISGPKIKESCIRQFINSGAHVFDCGMASTPAMFMTTVTEKYMCDGAVMITASHLPYDRNGLKFFTVKGGLEKTDITDILTLAQENRSIKGNGSCEKTDLMTVYSELLAEKVRQATEKKEPLKGLKIIVDAGNGAGGFYAEKVLKPLGADTEGSQFLEPDGTFPNHIPNPENNEAMESIVEAVKNTKADFGIIFDTDVDRASAVDKGGIPLNRNRLIAAISSILINEHTGSTIVTDSITSDGLSEFIEAKGGKHHRFKRGYKNVINEAVRLNELGQYTPLAIETSGHAALKENYFLDDGAYLVTRFIIELAKLHSEGKAFSTLIDGLKEPEESIEFRLPILTDDFKTYGNKIIEHIKKTAETDNRLTPAEKNFEGIRISFDKNNGNGWFLFRLSLHEPLIPVNIESNEKGGTKKIASVLYEIISKYDKLDMTLIKNFIK